MECTQDLARFYLILLQIYITDNDNFYKELIDTWNNEIKPFIIKTFPLQKDSGQFNLNSDIHFFIELVDMALKGKKIIKKKIVSKMRKLIDIFQENNEKPKRTNSMTPLRPHSQTIDSKATRASSIKKENSGFVKQSSEKNIMKLKDKNNNKIEKEIKIEETKNFQSLTEEKNDEEIIPNNEINKEYEMKFDEFLNKIINDKYFMENIKLIYHFCQQCFSFMSTETLFNQILTCYEDIKKNNIDNSNEKLNNLMEFTNVLFIEMINYYTEDNNLYNCIIIPKNLYYELISDLIINLSNKNKTNTIEPFKSEEENNNNIIIKTDIENNIINKKNLIGKNIINKENKKKFYDEDEKKEKEEKKEEDIPEIIKKSKTSSIKFRNSARFSLKTPNNKIKNDENKDESKKQLRNSIKYFSSKKIKIKEEIKEESDESENEENNKINNELYSEEKEKKDEKKNKILEDIIEKAKISTEILSSKELQLKNLSNIIILFDKIKEKDILDKCINNLKEMKNDMKIYKELQSIKEKEKMEYIIFRQRQKRMTKDYSSSFFASRHLSTKKKEKKETKDFLQKGYFCVMDWKTEEIGNQLMIISRSLLSKIYPRELYKAKFLKNDKDITSPNVINCIKKFNRLTSFIMEDILSYNSPKDRAKVYEKWVLIAEYCLINKDYNDLIAIFSAFNHYIITGLKLTLKEVKTKTNNILNKIKSFCAVEGNYLKIRKDMENCIKNRENFIPYLGMLLRDLNFFEEKSKYINEKGIINFEKIEKINEMFEKFFKFKEKENKNIMKIKELEFFNDLEDMTEEELEKIAENVEPENKLQESKKVKKRLTNIDIKYFDQYKEKEEDEPEDLDTAFFK